MITLAALDHVRSWDMLGPFPIHRRSSSWHLLAVMWCGPEKKSLWASLSIFELCSWTTEVDRWPLKVQLAIQTAKPAVGKACHLDCASDSLVKIWSWTMFKVRYLQTEKNIYIGKVSSLKIPLRKGRAYLLYQACFRCPNVPSPLGCSHDFLYPVNFG